MHTYSICNMIGLGLHPFSNWWLELISFVNIYRTTLAYHLIVAIRSCEQRTAYKACLAHCGLKQASKSCTASEPLASGHPRTKTFGQIREVSGIERSIPICECILGPNSMTGFNSVADSQRLGLERFHCVMFHCRHNVMPCVCYLSGRPPQRPAYCVNSWLLLN